MWNMRNVHEEQFRQQRTPRSSWHRLRANPWLLAVGAFALLLIAGVGMWRSQVDATPDNKPTLTQLAAPQTPVPGDPNAAPAPGVPPVPTPTQRDERLSVKGPVEPESKETQITFTTIPPTYARVTWGKQVLGRITPKQPLIVTRPRDSGPLDVVISANGFLPVQTRAHTFADTLLEVKLTPPELKNTLFGYKAPIEDAGLPEELSDGGVPEGSAGSEANAPSMPAPAPVPSEPTAVTAPIGPEQQIAPGDSLPPRSQAESAFDAL